MTLAILLFIDDESGVHEYGDVALEVIEERWLDILS